MQGPEIRLFFFLTNSPGVPNRTAGMCKVTMPWVNPGRPHAQMQEGERELDQESKVRSPFWALTIPH